MDKKKDKGGDKGKKKGGDKNDNSDKGGDKDKKLKACNFVKARHILCEKMSKIEEIYKQLTETYGKNPPASEFGKFAQEHSDCPSKKRGGELGFFGRGQMVGDFETVAFSLQPGQMSDIVKTKHGYHLILVEDRKASLK
jgi:parvulin-like peptidyl-prolyl isomerase